MTPPQRAVEAKVLSRTERFRNRFFRLVTDELALPRSLDEPNEHRSVTVRRDYITEHLGAVGVVVYDERTEAVLLIRQYRHPVGRQLWELPAGLLDVAGETALDCAKRELAEETDCSAARWDVLLDLLVTPGSSDEAIRVFLARDVSKLPEDLWTERTEEEAGMVTEWAPLGDAVARVLAGEIENAACVAGLLALQHAKNANWPPLRAAEANWRFWHAEVPAVPPRMRHFRSHPRAPGPRHRRAVPIQLPCRLPLRCARSRDLPAA